MLVVRDLNLNDSSASINKVCSVSGCDPDSLLNKVWSPHCGPKCEGQSLVVHVCVLYTFTNMCRYQYHFSSHGVLIIMLGG